MTDWTGIAKAHGLTLSERELERVAAPLSSLEATFRPLVKQLTADMEPDFELHLTGEGE